MEFVIGEDGVLRERKEPYKVVELPTKEDADKLDEVIAFYNEHHCKESEILKTDYSVEFDKKKKSIY